MDLENEQELCSICLSELKENEKLHILDCNHTFHTDCIIEWFRKSNNGKCPCCMDTPMKNNFNYFWNNPWTCNKFIDNRYKVIKKKMKTDTKLKSKVNTIDKKQKELVSLKNELKELKRDEVYKNFKKKNSQLNKKINDKEKTIRSQKCDIISKYPTVMYVFN